MPVFEVSKKFHTSTAHFLRGHKGKCAFLHGHNYGFTCKIVVDSPVNVLNSLGMLVDFALLDDFFEQFIKPYDHAVLLPAYDHEVEALLDVMPDMYKAQLGLLDRNRVIGFGENPTAEALGKRICGQMISMVEDRTLILPVQCYSPNVHITCTVGVDETENCSAQVTYAVQKIVQV